MDNYKLNMLTLIEQINQMFAQQEPRRVYQVWQTNADLESIAMLYSGPSLDWAESLALKLLAQSAYTVDYMVYCETTQEILAYAFSEQTKSSRGECQD